MERCDKDGMPSDIFSQSSDELREYIKKKAQDGLRKWLADRNSILEKTSPSSLSRYLHENFENVPCDRHAISEAASYIGEYFEEPIERRHLMHIIGIGDSPFIRQHFMYILQNLLAPIAAMQEFVIHEITERRILNQDIDEVIELIPPNTRIIFIDCAGTWFDPERFKTIVSTIDRKLEHELLITTWSRSAWDRYHSIVTAIPHRHRIIHFASLSDEDIDKAIASSLTFISPEIRLPKDVREFIVQKSDHNVDRAMEILIGALYEASRKNASCIDMNAAIVGMIGAFTVSND